jgi:hypothetical protein
MASCKPYRLHGRRILSENTLTQFGRIGGVVKEFTQGDEFEDIDYKPDNPRW